MAKLLKLFNFFKKNKTNSKPVEPKTYTVKLQSIGEDYPAYTFTQTPANSPEEAAESCKKFLAENGWWPFHSTFEQRMNWLTVVEVTLNNP